MHRFALLFWCFFFCSLSAQDFVTATQQLQWDQPLNSYPSFKELASECQSVVEIGPLTALLEWSNENRLTYTCYELGNHKSLPFADLICLHDITPSYLIETLEQFCPLAEKYIALFRPIGNDGLGIEITDFLQRHPNWALASCERAYNELILLKQVSHQSNLERILKNKMILCTGPSLHKKELLKKVTEQDLKLIPFKKIFLSTNDPAILDIQFGNQKPICKLLDQRGHQLDCINTIFTTLEAAAKDPECLDDDIILFKHESCYINDLYLLQKAVQKMENGYDLIFRYIPHIYWQIPATNGFLIRVGAAKNLLMHVKRLFSRDLLIRNLNTYKSAENLFYTVIRAGIAQDRRFMIPVDHNHRGAGELGLFHIHPRTILPCNSWDKKNYYEIY